MSVRSTALGFVLVLLGGLSGAAFAAERVGQVLQILGSCEVATDGQRRPLQVSSPVHLLDVVTTGANARPAIGLNPHHGYDFLATTGKPENSARGTGT